MVDAPAFQNQLPVVFCILYASLSKMEINLTVLCSVSKRYRENMRWIYYFSSMNDERRVNIMVNIKRVDLNQSNAYPGRKIKKDKR